LIRESKAAGKKQFVANLEWGLLQRSVARCTFLPLDLPGPRQFAIESCSK